MARIFHKVRDILQCHRMFHIELAEAIKVWDKEERIGNIFTASVRFLYRQYPAILIL